jgi:hypothetical protein
MDVQTFSKQINLVPQEFRRQRGIARFVNFARRTSFAVLGIYLVLILILGATTFVLSAKKKEASLKKEELVSQIESLRGAETLLAALKNRLSQAAKIASQPSTSAKIFEDAIGSLPSSVKILGAETEKGAVSFSLSASSSAILADFFHSLYASKKYSEVVVRSISRTENGYSFQMTVR